MDIDDLMADMEKSLGKATKKRVAAKKRRRSVKKKANPKRYYAKKFRTAHGTPMIVTPYATFRGYGGYYDTNKKGNFSPTYGARLGATIGEGLHSFANMLGFGEYTVQQNSLMNSIDLGTSPPTVRNTKRGEATILSHREYIGDLKSGTFVSGTSPYDITTYAINPGNSALFPFGAKIAQCFQEYELRGMIVELKTLSSDFAQNLVMGSHFCGTQYNSLNAPPADKLELENLEYSTSAKPSCSIIHPIECARSLDVNTHLYIADDNNYEGGDKRFYDLGQLHIGSQGIPVSNVPIAEIWISYEVALYKPIIKPNLIHSYTLETLGITDLTPFGSTISLGVENSPGISVEVDNSTERLFFNLPNRRGKWLVNVMNYTASAHTFTYNGALSLNSNVVLQSWFSDGTGLPNSKDEFVCNPTANGQRSWTFVVDFQQQDTTTGATSVVAFDFTGIWDGAPNTFNPLKDGWEIIISELKGDLINAT